MGKKRQGSSKQPQHSTQPTRPPTWLIAAVVVAAVAAAIARSRTNPYRDLDDAAVATAAFEALRDARPNQARAAFAELVHRDADDSFAWSWLGRSEVALGDLDAAEAAYERALETLPKRLFDEDDNERRTIRTRRAQLELDLERVRGRLEARTAPTHAVTYRDMQRKHWREAQPGDEPLILTGFASDLSLDLIAERCGPKQVRPRRRHKNSTAWAAMNEGEETTISEFIHSQQKDAAVFDWPLQYCPDLLESIDVPPFAALDHVATAYGPSLFISFSAKGGGPHVDSGSTKFWQHVHAGRKEWSPAGVLALRPGRHRRDSSLAGASPRYGSGRGSSRPKTTGVGPSSATRGVLAFLGPCRRNATTGLVRRPWTCLVRVL